MVNYCQAPNCQYARDCQISLDYQDDIHLRGYYCGAHAIEQLDFYKSIIEDATDHAELVRARTRLTEKESAE